jgi:hypothetical protein
VLKIRRESGAGATGPRAVRAAQRHALSRSAKLIRTQGRTIPWKHAAIYAGLVLAAAIVIGVWDHAYEARQAALLKPPPPQVLAKNLVEDVVGANTVKNVTLDQRAATLEMTVQDVLIKPGQSLSERRKNVTTEGILAIQLLQSKLALKAVTLHIVDGTRALATVTSKIGDKAPTTHFASALQ